jgi:phenylacetate-CoA ligase
MGSLTIKRRLPEKAKRPLRYIYTLIPYKWRFGGRTYRSMVKFLEQSQFFSYEQHKSIQWNELKRLLNHSYLNTKYYRKIFDSICCDPRDITCIKDFEKLPFLTKTELSGNKENLKAINYHERMLYEVTTGGSTGTPTSFYERKIERSEIERAFNDVLLQRISYAPGDRTAVLRGSIVPRRSDGTHWQFNPKNNQLILSSYHLTKNTIELYAKLILKYEIKLIHAYPSAITLFANYLKNNDIRFPFLKGIWCTSEMLYPWQRDFITSVFPCKILNHYGLTERVVLGGDCPVSQHIHLFPEYGYTELINEKGKTIHEAGVVGEIVATGFTNYATPFIRYRTGDMGSWVEDHCLCGRHYPLLKGIEGRTQDLIQASDGRWITLTALIFAQHFDAFSRINKFQIIQLQKGKIVIKIIKTSGYSKDDEKEIKGKIINAAEGRLEMTFEYVKNIPTSKRGKHIFLIQNLNTNSQHHTCNNLSR